MTALKTFVKLLAIFQVLSLSAGVVDSQADSFCPFDSASDASCNFQITTPLEESILKWSIVKAGETPGPDLPKTDSTGSANGGYVVANFSGQRGYAEAYIESDKLTTSDNIKAIQFFYFMHGTNLATLQLLLRCSFDDVQVLWQRIGIGSSSPEWTAQQIPINDPSKLDNCQLIFKIMSDKPEKFRGVIALDSLSLSTTQSRPEPTDGSFTSFEYAESVKWSTISIASVTRPSASQVNWDLIAVSENKEKIEADKTFDSPNGHVMKMTVSGSSSISGCFSATLLSDFAIQDPAIEPTQCVQLASKWWQDRIPDEGRVTTAQIYVQLYDTATSSVVDVLWAGSLAVQAAMDENEWTTLLATLDLSAWSQLGLGKSQFHLVVEGVFCTESGIGGGIAIDDLRFDSNNCRLSGDDDFELAGSIGQWAVEPVRDENTLPNWARVQANHTMSYLSPPVDHTFLGSQPGWVLVSDSDIYSFTQLDIDMHHITTAFCLNFWVWTKNDENMPIKEITVRNINKKYGPAVQEYRVVLPSKYMETWELVTLPFVANTYSTVRVIIEARGGFAIDDITYSNNPCGLRSAETMSDTTIGDDVAIDLGNSSSTAETVDICDFETNDCSMWTVATSSLIESKDHFVVTDAPTGFSSMNGPIRDAVSNDSMPGNYVLLVTQPDGSKSTATDLTAFVYSEEINANEVGCFVFYYYIFGPATGSLKVYLYKGSQMLPLWTKQGSQQDKWLTAQINLAAVDWGQRNENDTIRLIVEAERYADYYYGAIAVDGLELLTECNPAGSDHRTDYDCSFEGDDRPACQLHFEMTPDFNIAQVNSLPLTTGLQNDASHGTELGHVVFSPDVAWSEKSFYFLSPDLSSCMTFSYQRGSPCVNLWLTVENESGDKLLRRQLLLPAGDPADFNTWRKLNIDLSREFTAQPLDNTTITYRRVIITAMYDERDGIFGCDWNGTFNWIAFDEFSFTLSSCVRRVACNFGSYCGQFEMNSLPTSSYMPLLRGLSRSHLSHIRGPITDSSNLNFQLAPGSYGLVDLFSARGEDDLATTALFQTDWLFGSAGGKHVSLDFFYFFNPPGPYIGSGELRVYLDTESSSDLLWTIKQSTGKWQFGRAVAMKPETRYRLSIRGYRHGSANDTEAFVLAVDGINVVEGLAGSPVPMNAKPGPKQYHCSFMYESDAAYCNFQINWRQDPSDNMAWAIANLGDSEIVLDGDLLTMDSVGNPEGSYTYLFVNPNVTGIKVAQFESVPITSEDNTTAIEFSYFIFGTSLAWVKLTTQCSDGEHVLWQQKAVTNKAPRWMRQQVPVRSEISVGCSLVFEASVDDTDKAYHGVIAIDDIVTSPMWRETENRDHVCSFEHDACTNEWSSVEESSLSTDRATPVTWQATRAGSTAAVGDDHTLSSPEGSVMLMTAPSDGSSTGCFSAVLRSQVPIDDIANNPIQCLTMSSKFLFEAGKAPTGQILVHITIGSSYAIGTLWSGSLKVDADSSSWSVLNARLDMTQWALQMKNTLGSQTYHLAVEGIVCSSESMSTLGIAIDNLGYNTKTCRLTGDEDFEGRFAVFNNEPGVALTGYNWLRVNSNHTHSYLSPPTDHTFLGQSVGGLLVSEDDITATTQLAIDMHHVTSQFCLNFWAWTRNDGLLAQKKVVVRSQGASSENYSVTFTADYVETWELVTIPIEATTATVTRVIIEAQGGIAIDDFFYTNHPCSSLESAVVTVSLSSKNTKSSSSPIVRANTIYSCTFEEAEGCDQWTIASSSVTAVKDHLLQVNATYGQTTLDGPKEDATLGSGSGHYAILEPNLNAIENPEPTAMTAFLYSEAFNISEVGCLTFRYYIYGPATGSVKVYAMAGGVDMLPLWSRHGSEMDSWQTAEIDLTHLEEILTDSFKLIIEAERSMAYYYGAIAFDDIELTDNCSASTSSAGYSCYFDGNDDDLCSLNMPDQSDGNAFKIVRVNSLPLETGLLNDASQGVETGSVLMANDVTTASQKISFNNPETTGCLSFAYQRASPCIMLEVGLSDALSENTYRRQLILPQGDPADFDEWRTLTVDLPRSFLKDSAGMRLVTFTASYYAQGLFGCKASKPQWIAMDSFYFSENNCIRQDSCNFGSHCDVFNMQGLPTPSYMPWLVAKDKDKLSQVPGPAPSTNMREYVLVDLYHARGSDSLASIAAVTTQWLLGSGKDITINFQYYFSPMGMNPASGMLEVVIETSVDGYGNKTILWQLDQGDASWQFGRAVTMQPVGLYRISFLGYRRSASAADGEFSLAIDYINIVEGVSGVVLPIDAVYMPSTTTSTTATTPTTTPTPDSSTSLAPVTSTATSGGVSTTTTSGITDKITTDGGVVTGEDTTSPRVTTADGATTATVKSTETTSAAGTTKPGPTSTSSVGTTNATTEPLPQTTLDGSTGTPTIVSTTAPIDLVYPEVSGQMTVDEIIVDGQALGWANISASTDLETKAKNETETQLKLIYERAGHSVQSLTVSSLVEVSASALVRATSSIGANYDAVLADTVSSSAINEAEFEAQVNQDLEQAVTEMAQEGLFNETFGGEVSVSAKVVIPEPDDTSGGLSDGDIAGIVIGSVAGFILLVGLGFFGFRYYQSKNKIATTTPASQSYYDNARYMYEDDESSQRSSSTSSSSSSSSSGSEVHGTGRGYGTEMSSFNARQPNAPPRQTPADDMNVSVF